MLTLQRPREDLVLSYFEFIEEMRQHGEKIWEGLLSKPNESMAQFARRLFHADTQPTSGLVPETTYWACEENRVVGRIALRHYLNDNLQEFGGHIGYEVRPSCRRLGFAKEMLRQLLQTPKAKEIGDLLLTCAPDNIASNKTILACGGKLSGTAFVEKWKRQTNYYWIRLADRYEIKLRALAQVWIGFPFKRLFLRLMAQVNHLCEVAWRLVKEKIYDSTGTSSSRAGGGNRPCYPTKRKGVDRNLREAVKYLGLDELVAYAI